MRNGRQVLLTSASVLALSIASSGGAFADGYEPVGKGFAPPKPMRTISGTAAIYGSYSDLDCHDDIRCGEGGGNSPIEDNPWSIGGDARVDIPLSDTVSVQIDQYGEAMLSEQTTSEDYTGGYLAGLHLNARAPNQYLFGVFGGGGRLHFASTNDDAYNQWLVGVEGQYYHYNTTFYGQVGYTDSEANQSNSSSFGYEVMSEAYFLRGVVRHYMNGGKTKLEGEVGWASGENDQNPRNTTDDVDMIAWGVELEHVLKTYGDDGFLSGFVRYQGQDYDEDFAGGSDDATAHTVKVGIRMDLNQLNPLTRERTGAAVDLPDLNRWIGHSRLVE